MPLSIAVASSLSPRAGCADRRAPRPRAATSATATARIRAPGGSHRALVACGDGGRAVLLHLPRRHRRGQGRRREDDRRRPRLRSPRRARVSSVLIVEVEGKSGLPTMFARRRLGYDEIDLDPSIRARFLTPDAGARRLPRDPRDAPHLEAARSASGALEVVATAVPGMKDILVLGKVKSLDEARAADLLIVDAPAAGHAITFLLSPRGLLDAVRVGPIRKQAADVVALLSDPARCQVHARHAARGDARSAKRSTPRSRSRTAPASRSARSS